MMKQLLLAHLLLLQFGILQMKSEDLEDKPIDWKTIKPKICVNDDEFNIPDVKKVQVKLAITSVYEISEENMDFGLQVLVTLTWLDPYLNFTVIVNTVSWAVLPNSIRDCIWKPDVIFQNAKRSTLYTDTIPNSLTRIVVEGESFHLHQVERYMLIVGCNMDFHLYPLDTQHCSLELTTLVSASSTFDLVWDEDKSIAVTFRNKIKPLNFDIVFIDANSTWPEGSRNVVLLANMIFIRSLMASIVNIYVPSFLVVCLSMVSFWIDVAAVPGRVTLGVTSILTLATSITQARGSLPTLNYMTAMDVWLLGCMITVFLSLIEFTLAQAWSRQTPNAKPKTSQDSKQFVKKSNFGWTDHCVDIKSPNTFNVKRRSSTRCIPFFKRRMMRVAQSKVDESMCKKPESVIKKDNALDRASRIFFPLAFTSFTVFYWLYFMNLAYN